MSGLWRVILAPLEAIHTHKVENVDQLKDALSMSQSVLQVLETGLLPVPTQEKAILVSAKLN